MLLMQAFNSMKTALTKHELRYLMHKFKFPEDKVQELETTYHGKENLPNRYQIDILYFSGLCHQVFRQINT